MQCRDHNSATFRGFPTLTVFCLGTGCVPGAFFPHASTCKFAQKLGRLGIGQALLRVFLAVVEYCFH